MDDKNKHHEVERGTVRVEVEKVKISNIALPDILSKDFIEKLNKIGESTKTQIDPIAFIFMTESIEDDKKIHEPVILAHESKKDYLEKRLSITVNKKVLMDEIIKALSD